MTEKLGQIQGNWDSVRITGGVQVTRVPLYKQKRNKRKTAKQEQKRKNTLHGSVWPCKSAVLVLIGAHW